MNFTGLSIYSANPGGGILGFSDLRVRNSMAPLIRSANRHPNGGATLGFPTEPDTFYSLEATDSLSSPLWRPPTAAYQLGSAGPGNLSDSQTGAASCFYRLRVE